MSDIAEGVGGAIEGALAGRAVEPRRGEAEFDPSLPTGDHGTCANCGSAAPGQYCPECGQKTHIHRTLSAIAHDLVHGVLHLDGKLTRTLPLLVFKPGKLTRRYIEGERARFVSPMSMFLFSVFSMFAIFQIVGISTPSTFDRPIGMEDVGASVQTAIENTQRSLRETEEQLANVGDDEAERAALEQRKSELEAELTELTRVADLPFIDAKTPAIEVNEDGSRSVPISNDSNARMNFKETGIDWIDDGLAKKWKDNPGLMLYKLQANAYKFSWLLIPLSIPFVWLTFAWKRRFKAYDHAIFVTYSLAFTSLLFIVVSVLMTYEPVGWLGGLLLVFVPPIHLYKHLRYTYELSRFSTIWRLFAISLFIWIVVGLFLQVLLMLGAF